MTSSKCPARRPAPRRATCSASASACSARCHSLFFDKRFRERFCPPAAMGHSRSPNVHQTIMHEENKTKLMTPEEAATLMDLRRDYVYGRGVAVENDETHLRDYWRIVRRRLWIPIGVVIVTVTLATIYNLRLPSVYEG